jgi:hypothetical protein
MGAGAARAEELPVLSPAAQQAVKDLSAEGFAVREKALKTLQAAMAAQLKELASVNDEEAQQRIIALMEYQDCMTRWVIETMHLPAEQRAKVLAWGLKADVSPVIAKTYAMAAERRVEGIKELGAREDAEASWLLARLIGDERRDVYLAAMDAVWDRKPADEVIAALWQRGVAGNFALYRSGNAAAGVAAAPLVIRGRAVVLDGVMMQTRGGDSDAAVDTLIHINSPQVSEKLKKLAAEITKEPEKYPNIVTQLMPYNEWGRSFLRLVEAYKSPEALGFLVTLIEREVAGRQQVSVNGKTLFVSNRTLPLVTLITLTGQKPEDYSLNRSNGIWNTQWCAGSEKEETDAINAFKAWFDKNKEGAKDEKGAATAPAKG